MTQEEADRLARLEEKLDQVLAFCQRVEQAAGPWLRKTKYLAVFGAARTKD